MVKNLANIKKISIGTKHALVVEENDDLYTWGTSLRNENSFQGFSKFYSPKKLNLINYLKDIETIKCLVNSTIIINKEGQMFYFGYLNNFNYKRTTKEYNFVDYFSYNRNIKREVHINTFPIKNIKEIEFWMNNFLIILFNNGKIKLYFNEQYILDLFIYEKAKKIKLYINFLIVFSENYIHFYNFKSNFLNSYNTKDIELKIFQLNNSIFNEINCFHLINKKLYLIYNNFFNDNNNNIDINWVLSGNYDDLKDNLDKLLQERLKYNDKNNDFKILNFGKIDLYLKDNDYKNRLITSNEISNNIDVKNFNLKFKSHYKNNSSSKNKGLFILNKLLYSNLIENYNEFIQNIINKYNYLKINDNKLLIKCFKKGFKILNKLENELVLYNKPYCFKQIFDYSKCKFFRTNNLFFSINKINIKNLKKSFNNIFYFSIINNEIKQKKSKFYKQIIRVVNNDFKNNLKIFINNLKIFKNNTLINNNIELEINRSMNLNNEISYAKPFINKSYNDNSYTNYNNVKKNFNDFNISNIKINSKDYSNRNNILDSNHNNILKNLIPSKNFKKAKSFKKLDNNKIFKEFTNNQKKRELFEKIRNINQSKNLIKTNNTFFSYSKINKDIKFRKHYKN